jgi:two-component system, cell cycle sensor histidine kinase and response regulator CckA
MVFIVLYKILQMHEIEAISYTSKLMAEPTEPANSTRQLQAGQQTYTIVAKQPVRSQISFIFQKYFNTTSTPHVFLLLAYFAASIVRLLHDQKEHPIMSIMTKNQDPKTCCGWHIFLLAGIIFSCLFIQPSLSRADYQKKTVLYLNSYHNGYHWSDGLLEGIRTVLNQSHYKVDLQIEYMDAKKYDYDIISSNLYSLYKEKFKDEVFDVIILSDNDALNFVNQHRNDLFKNIPVVFCGVNDLKDSDIKSGNITGIAEIYDFLGTLNVAKTLHPARDHLVFLIDNSTTGTAIRHQAEKLIQENDLGLKTEFWIQLSLEETQKRVAALPDDTFLFIAPYYQTIDGRFYTSEEVTEAIYQHSSVPIYSSWEFMVGFGTVGGKVLSGIEHGKIAGEMALQILNGTKADDIPIIREPDDGIYLFDYKVMEKLGINQKLLPANSKIINAPKAIYSLSKELFWTMMVSFVILFLALVSMVGAMLERRKVERKITNQLAFQETLMDTIPQLVSWKDVEGRYLGVNQAFMDFFGIENTLQVVGKKTGDILSDSTYSDWSINADSSVIDKREAFRKIRRKVVDMNGAEAWIEVNKVPLRGQDEPIVGILTTAENITKEQNLEKQLLQSQKMEAIGTLAGGIAHDFNNILTSIINSTELAIGDLAPGSQTEADLNRVLKAARRGGRVVQQILSFSRPSREGFRPTDLAQVVQEVAHLMEASMPANIVVSSHFEQGRNFFVHADPTQMHQAILNLCTNSYHALRITGGKIDIRLAHVLHEENITASSHTVAKNLIQLSVSDNGPGIKPEIVDKIFDPFFSTKSKTEGTGLGLAVVHGIIKNHQGTIEVSCSNEGGATFDIFLPESEACSDIVSSSLGREHEVGGHILFVEDDEDQLQTTPRLLEDMGFCVTALREPKAAIRLVSAGTHNFDILITDFDMPIMSGVVLAGLLPELPVILISGRDDARVAAKEYPNIHNVIIKPYHRKDLMEAIREVIKNGEKHAQDPNN